MRRIAAALGVSLLLHALLFLLLWRTAPPPPAVRAPEPRAPLAFEVVERPAQPRPTAKPPTAAPPPRRTSALPPSRTPALPQAGPSAPLASDVPRAPPSVDLHPLFPGTPPPGSAPPSRGHTLRPGDPSLSPEVQREEERARVQDRVDGFMAEAASAARAHGGLPHPYLVELRNALQTGLKASVPASPEALGLGKGMRPLLDQFTRNYHASAEQYARTGSPGIPVSKRDITAGEKARELIPDADFVRFLIQLKETRDAMLDRAPLLALTLELTQGRDGALLASAIVESSGSRAFDALVLQAAPGALGAAGPPPAEAFHRDSLRSLWRVEGRLELTPAERASLLSAIPDVNGLPAQQVLRHYEGTQLHLSYGARLLRYE